MIRRPADRARAARGDDRQPTRRRVRPGRRGSRARLLRRGTGGGPIGEISRGVLRGSRVRARCLPAFSAEGEKKDDAEEEADEGEGGGEGDEETEKLRAELDERDAQVKDLNDKLLRTLADMENLRERTRRQAEAAEKFAIQGFCKDLLDVADNLGRAVSTVEVGEDADATKTAATLESLHEGVLMVEKQLASTLAKHGVEKYDPTGEPFDANDHMALFNVPLVEGAEAGTVAAVTKAGYRLHDRVIGAAEVGVYQA